MNFQKIYTFRMAKWLTKQGFNPVDVITNLPEYRSKLVYVFEDTQELQKAIKLYLMTEALKDD